MKNSVLSLLAGAALLTAAVCVWSPSLQAQSPPGAAGEAVTDPIGRLCVVTLDPQGDALPNRLGDSQKKSGLTSDYLTEGTLISVDADWVVLRDGTYENWIPRGKVLMLRASR